MGEKISVIVPIYNVAPYLRECIESILNQDYKNLEILLVDDGSTDDCGMICDEYAMVDNRIRVFHKENGGLSSARNLGIKEASGKYISFIDSDDYVAVDFLSTLYNNLKQYKVKISAIGCVHLFPNKEVVYKDLRGINRLYNEEEAQI